MKKFINFLKGVFQSKTSKQLESLAQTVETVLEERNELKSQVEILVAKNAEHEEKEAAIQAKKDGKEPWVNLNTTDFDPERGFKVDLDWNDAFIHQLKEAGIDGPNDDFIIQKWLAYLYEDIVKQLDAKSDAKKEETGSVSDYE